MVDTTIRFSEESVGGGPLGAQAPSVQMGVQGGSPRPMNAPRTGAQWFNNVGGMTTDLGGNLPEFINAAFAPALETTKRKREWEGFVAARSGQTMQEIEGDKPWYSRLFGPTNFEIGALNYTTLKQTADMETDLLQRMPELRKLSPQAWAEEMNRVSEAAMTGNPYADTVLRKSFMDRAGELTDLYTKERNAWQNQEQLRMQVDAGIAAGRAFNEKLRAAALLGDQHPDDPQVAARMEESQLAFADSLITSEFQTDESRFAFYRSVALALTENGDFYALNHMFDMGLKDALSVEEREQLEQEVQAKRAQYYARRPIDDPLLQAEVQWRVASQHGHLSPEESVALGRDINRRNTAATGDREPIILHADASRPAASALGAVYTALKEQQAEMQRAAEAADTEAAKEQVRAQRREAAAHAAATGALGTMLHTDMLDESDANQAMVSLFQQNPAEAMTAAVRNYNNPDMPHVNSALKTAIQQGIPPRDGAGWTPTFERSYTLFTAMENVQEQALDGSIDTTSGVNSAREYFGEENTELFRLYRQQREVQGMDPETAYSAAVQALSRTPRGRGELNEDEFNTVEDVLNGSNWLVRQFTGETKLVNKGVLLSAAVEQYPIVDRLYPDRSMEQKAEMAVQFAKSRGNVDSAGEYSWNRWPHQKPITAYANDVAPDAYGVALRNFIRGSAKTDAGDTLKINGNEFMHAHRSEDRDGFPVLHIWMQDEDGRVSNQTLTRAEFERVEREAEELVLRKIERNREALKNIPQRVDPNEPFFAPVERDLSIGSYDTVW